MQSHQKKGNTKNKNQKKKKENRMEPIVNYLEILINVINSSQTNHGMKGEISWEMILRGEFYMYSICLLRNGFTRFYSGLFYKDIYIANNPER